jgi:two-component SAPR family response regulator
VSEQIHIGKSTPSHGGHSDQTGLLKGESDRSTDCRRVVDAVGVHSRSVVGGSGIIPVAVFTLGRFSLLINGQPADLGRKFPQRPLELLKAIIAQGGREISISRLTVLLWPDVDGDKATRSFDTTLHRLRKILGDDRVLVLRDGKLSLDACYCWVDVWAFERLLGGSRRLLRNKADGNRVDLLEGLTENLLALYQDHFLIREDVTSWSVSMRERLRHKFIHHLIEVGRFWESHGGWEQAIECYRKGIDVDDLVEVFYQRLINCYLETHRLSEGMLVYRRCYQTLSVMLGLQPEAETESLYRALRNARPGNQSA